MLAAFANTSKKQFISIAFPMNYIWGRKFNDKCLKVNFSISILRRWPSSKIISQISQTLVSNPPTHCHPSSDDSVIEKDKSRMVHWVCSMVHCSIPNVSSNAEEEVNLSKRLANSERLISLSITEGILVNKP